MTYRRRNSRKSNFATERPEHRCGARGGWICAEAAVGATRGISMMSPWNARRRLRSHAPFPPVTSPSPGGWRVRMAASGEDDRGYGSNPDPCRHARGDQGLGTGDRGTPITPFATRAGTKGQSRYRPTGYKLKCSGIPNTSPPHPLAPNVGSRQCHQRRRMARVQARIGNPHQD